MSAKSANVDPAQARSIPSRTMTEQNEAAPPPEPAAPAAALDRPRLKKLVIHRYRHVKPGTTLVFDDTWNVIVGKNGTGKTTLLKLIEKLLVFSMEGPGRDPFIVDVEMSVGSGLLSTHMEWNCSPTRPTNGLSDELDLKLSGEFRDGTRHARWTREPFSTGTTVEAGPTFLIPKFLPPQLLVQILLPRVRVAPVWSSRFEEALGYFEEIVGSWILERLMTDAQVVMSEPEFVPLVIRRGA